MRTIRMWLDGILVDARQVYRSLARAKTFTLATAVTFAFGIGVNVAVFSVLDRLLFRPLPYAAPGELTQIHLFAGRIDDSISAAMMPLEVTSALEQGASSFTGLSYEAGWLDSPALGAEQTPLVLLPVSTNALTVLGVRPLIGREFESSDGLPGSENAVLLTYQAWRTRFGAAPSVTSQTFQVGRRSYRIVGVLPPGFFFPSSRFVEHLDGLSAVKSHLLADGRLIIAPVARLRPGLSAQMAQAEVDVLVRHHSWTAAHLRRNAAAGRLRIFVQPLRSGLTMIVGPYLWLTTSIVWILLLIACVNLSTLLLMRGLARQHTMATRVAVGATVGRLVRLAVLETGMVCLVGAGIGWVLCVWLHNWIFAAVPPTLRGFVATPLDTRILLVTVGATCVCALIGATIPALAVRKVDLLSVLHVDAPERRGRVEVRSEKVLLGAEAALGVLVTVGAATVVPDFAGFLMQPASYREADLFTVTVNHDWETSDSSSSNQAARVRTITDVLRTLPDVQFASAALPTPFANVPANSEFWRRSGQSGREFGVGPGLFQTIQAPLRAGREFLPAEIGDVPLAMVNEAGAHALWPGEPLSTVPGRFVKATSGERKVIGVVRNIRTRPGAPATLDLYLPIGAGELESQQTALPIVVRMKPGTIPNVRLLTSRLNEQFPPNGVRVLSVAAELAPVLDRPRFLAVLLGTVAGVAVLLATVGVYGLASLESVRRRREMAIRLALGASRRHVRGRVLVRVVPPVLVGTVIGLIGATVALRTLRASIRELASPEAAIYLSAASIVLAAAGAAAWWSSRRVTSADPSSVLRAPTS